uniref:DUF38 domain-containing protein n=1 Tax=Panagrolaimus davidi TaxID=227884 RepID=A0A914PH58_9BILA
MSGKEPFNIALKWFCKQNFPDVSVNRKQWTFKTVMDPARRCEKWLFDNFTFIKSLKIAHCVLDLELIHANVNDIPFLEDLEALVSLKITTQSVDEFKEIILALKNLKAVKELELNVPKSDSSLFDLITFEVESIKFYSFMFEKELKCKLRRDIKCASFYGDKELRLCFIYEPQHFANYLRKLPKV